MRAGTARGRVLVLTAEPPDAAGGMEATVGGKLAALRARGYEAEVVHSRNSGIPPWVWSSHLPVRLLRTALVGYFVGKKASRRLADGVVAVISHGPVGWYPVRSTDLLRVHFYHGTYRGLAEATRPFLSRGGYLWLKWWESMLLERRCGAGKLCVANSLQTRDEVGRWFGYDAATVWVPIDTEKFRPLDRADCRRRLGLPLDRPIALFVGHLDPVKGSRVISALAHRMKDVVWVMALRGGVREALALREGNLAVFRSVPHDCMSAFYNAADVVVCPSLYESFGRVVAEAVACGTPVVASPGGASRWLLDGQAPREWLVQDRLDADGFAKGIRNVLDRRAESREIVMARLRPRVGDTLAISRWWNEFSRITGL